MPLEYLPMKEELLALKHDFSHVTIDGQVLPLDYTAMVSPARKIFWMMLNCAKALFSQPMEDADVAA